MNLIYTVVKVFRLRDAEITSAKKDVFYSASVSRITQKAVDDI